MQSYPIWNKIQACIYKSSKCYGVKNDGLNEILIGTSAKNSHSFVRTRVTHKKHEDGTRTYHFYIDDKLYKKATLKKKDVKPLIELVADNIVNEEINSLREEANEYRIKRRDSIDSLTKKRVEAQNKLINVINPILADYSKKNSISMIIQKKNIIIGKSELEITDDILKILDKTLTTIDLN